MHSSRILFAGGGAGAHNRVGISAHGVRQDTEDGGRDRGPAAHNIQPVQRAGQVPSVQEQLPDRRPQRQQPIRIRQRF